MNIDELNAIKSMFPERFFKKGMVYFRHGHVVGLSFNRLNESWFAEVVGTQSYYSEVKVKDLFTGDVDMYCDCPAYATYATCKHLVAVLLEMSERNAFVQEEKREVVTERFIEQIVRQKSRESVHVIEKIPMQVEYILTLDYENKVQLQFRTGISHRYVVQNVRDLLDHVLHGAGYYFTKKFSYDPEYHYFLNQDIEIFTLLANVIHTGDFFSNRAYNVNQDYDRREIPVPPLLLQQLLEKLKERNVVVETEAGRVEGIALVYEEIPSAFTMQYNEQEELALTTDMHVNLRMLNDYQALYDTGTFYFPTTEQWNVFKTIWQFNLEEKGLAIQAEQKNTFFSEVLPVLQNVSEVEIKEEVAKEVVHYPLRATFHLKQKEEAIIGSLAYHYGSYTFDPFQMSEPTDRIVLRDIEKEDEIMSLIEQSNFRYNGENLSIQLMNDEDVYDFLYTILPLLDEKVELYLTSDIKSLIVEREPIPSTNVNVESDSNLLSINFDISEVDEAEVDAMIKAVIERQRFYRLQSGALVSLENEQFHSLRELFTELDAKEEDFVDGTLSVPVYKGMRVDDVLQTEKRYAPAFRKLLHHLKSPEEQLYEVPEVLQATLRSYQETGFQWFKSLSEYHLGGILADDMGLGKTIQAIAYLLSEPSDRPHLIVVPSSVVYNWRNEFQKFAPSLDVAVIVGPKEDRKQKIETRLDADVWITSYGTARQDIKLYSHLQFNVLILDEAQYIKNYATKTSQAIRKVKAKTRFALTGTPIENSLHELWSIFQVILPGFMPSEREFNKWEPEKVAQLVRPFIMRRLKEDVLTELPEKIESTHVSQLTEEQKKLYVGYLRELQQEAAASLASNQFQQDRMKILAGLTRLRQLCCHPSLFIENYEGRSGKLDELMESVQSFRESGKRMLIFSQFTSMHELIIKELEREGIDYFYLHGQTPSEKRVAMSEAFNAGEKDVFLISLRAGGTGLNLTGADTVILYDLWWNPAVEDQAAGRAHRFGQKNVVQVIRFIAEGTIEERIYELQQKKRELIDQVIQPGETMLQSLSEDDIRELLNIT